MKVCSLCAALVFSSILQAQTIPPVNGGEPASQPALKTTSTPTASRTPADQPFRTQTTEVIVPITVTDDKGRFVSNLDARDFKIYDEGQEQTIQFFTRERNQPVVIGFLMDLSNASKIHWKAYSESAQELVSALLPNDPKYSGYLITYSTEAEVAVNTTSDPEKLLDRLRKIKPGGGAALYDAIYTACTSRKLVKGEPIEPRRIIVVIGDGHDNASKKGLDEVLELAQRNLVTIYGVSTMSFGFTAEGDKNLRRLADETGGRVEYPLENVYKDVIAYLEKPQDAGNFALTVGTGAYSSQLAQGMFRAIANVAGEVTTQYIIRYTPDVKDTPREAARIFRNIRVDVPGYEGIRIRARKGYYAGAVQ
ncbi:MAG: VWA domain-containing protein [Bryobacteraceae bacterium]|nr:VWA domain-containing protein [Bryobacteraceae bacterium]